MNARRNTPDGDRLDVLVTLVEAYERKHFPLGLPDPWTRSITTWSRADCSRAISFPSSAAATVCMKF
jgi:antitoxin component HigA of HigAB toxin-antitoxin module